jgi:hypothetical protein
MNLCKLFILLLLFSISISCVKDQYTFDLDSLEKSGSDVFQIEKEENIANRLRQAALRVCSNFFVENKDRLLSLVCLKLKSNVWKVPAHDRSSMGSYRKILTCAKKTGDKSTRSARCNPVYGLYRCSMA